LMALPLQSKAPTVTSWGFLTGSLHGQSHGD
jgi:hypothetical protein